MTHSICIEKSVKMCIAVRYVIITECRAINLKTIMEKREKIAYATYELAFAEVQRQVEGHGKPWLKSQKRCCRVYEQNGKFYLTSKPKIITF